MATATVVQLRTTSGSTYLAEQQPDGRWYGMKTSRPDCRVAIDAVRTAGGVKLRLVADGRMWFTTPVVDPETVPSSMRAAPLLPA